VIRWGKLYVPQYRRGCDRVGGRYDRADRDRGRPGNCGHQNMDHHRHRGGRQSNCDERQAGYRQPVPLQVAQRRIIGGIQQHGCHKQGQYQLRIDVEGDFDRQNSDYGSGDRQQHWIRQPKLACDHHHEHGRRQHHQDRFENDHFARKSPLVRTNAQERYTAAGTRDMPD
jgi:hypothetical protein